MLDDSLPCWVYRSLRKQEMYLYLVEEDGFDKVPAALMERFGQAVLVIELELSPQRKLAREDVVKVIANLREHGFLWFLHYRLATNLHELGRIPEALAEIDALLAMNPRLISVLVLKTKCHLDLFQGDEARAALEQLQWSISKSDPDFPARLKAAELETRVSALAGSP